MVSLRNLEKDGLVTRVVHADVLPRVEYSLTQLGTNLAHQLLVFIEWAAANSKEILAARNS
jgi:DNA-binding HxlR family transcriptional regulator